MKSLFAFLVCLLAGSVFSANPTFQAFKGTNGTTIRTNISGNLVSIDSSPGVNAASNSLVAQIASGQVWTNDVSVPALYPVGLTNRVLIGTNDPSLWRYQPGQFGVYSFLEGYVHPISFHTVATSNDIGGKIGGDFTIKGGSGFVANNSVALQTRNDLNSPTSVGVLYDFNDGASGFFGNANGGNGSGQGAGVIGYGTFSGNVNYGLTGAGFEAGATNVGVAGTGVGNSSVRVGGYFETITETQAESPVDPIFESAALIADNRTKGDPILIARTNNGTFKVLEVDGHKTTNATPLDVAGLSSLFGNWRVPDTNGLGGFISFKASTNSGSAVLYASGSPGSATVRTNGNGLLFSTPGASDFAFMRGVTTNLSIVGIATLNITNGVIMAVSGP